MARYGDSTRAPTAPYCRCDPDLNSDEIAGIACLLREWLVRAA
jgi:hypothetical protein